MKCSYGWGLIQARMGLGYNDGVKRGRILFSVLGAGWSSNTYLTNLSVILAHSGSTYFVQRLAIQYSMTNQIGSQKYHLARPQMVNGGPGVTCPSSCLMSAGTLKPKYIHTRTERRREPWRR